MSLLIGENQVVSIHYTLTSNEGDVLDSSEGQEPLGFLCGAGNIIPGLENALIGKLAGDKFQVTVQPEDGYGEIVPEMIQVVAKAAFQGVDNIEAGMSFEGTGEDGATQRVMVKAVEGEEVTIDANHPLAGVVLNFDIEIVDVRDASEEELSHGHAH